MAGYMRVLALIVQQPWGLRPLVVDPFRELSPAAVAAAQRTFDQAWPPSCRCVHHAIDIRVCMIS